MVKVAGRCSETWTTPEAYKNKPRGTVEQSFSGWQLQRSWDRADCQALFRMLVSKAANREAVHQFPEDQRLEKHPDSCFLKHSGNQAHNAMASQGQLSTGLAAAALGWVPSCIAGMAKRHLAITCRAEILDSCRLPAGPLRWLGFGLNADHSADQAWLGCV